MLQPARRTAFVGTFRVVPIAPRAPIAVSTLEKAGLPRTAAEWTALVRVASGDTDIAASHCARLLGLGLIERSLGAVVLTRHGRLTLGLAD